ncbi:MAG: hypothetical protein WBV23_04245 [Desulfobaccales bacterium]
MAEFIGKVIKKPFGIGSKSEHEAVFLETENNQYVLRRQGGNPFYDEAMQEIVGKTIRCTGVVVDYALLISDWAVLEEGEK